MSYGQAFKRQGFPGGSDDKESACNAGDLGSILLGQKDPLEKGMATHVRKAPGKGQSSFQYQRRAMPKNV